MTFIKKYWTLIAIAAAFAIGVLIAPRSDKDLERQFEKERKELQQQKRELNARIKGRNDQIQILLEKMEQDSVRNNSRLNASNKEIAHLKKKIRGITFQNHTTLQLDSLRAVLYGSDSLHSSN